MLTPLPLDELDWQVAEIPAEDVVSGSPTTAWAVNHKSPDGAIASGFYRISGGAFKVTVDYDEWVMVVDGVLTITAGDSTIQLGRGDTLVPPKGTTHVLDATAGEVIDYWVIHSPEVVAQLPDPPTA